MFFIYSKVACFGFVIFIVLPALNFYPATAYIEFERRAVVETHTALNLTMF